MVGKRREIPNVRNKMADRKWKSRFYIQLLFSMLASTNDFQYQQRYVTRIGMDFLASLGAMLAFQRTMDGSTQFGSMTEL